MVTLLLALLLAQQEIGLKEPLELKAYIDAPSPWFPSQEGKLIYEIRYKGQIQLVKEDLPLLEPKGFEKVGDKIIESRDELDYSVQRIYQKVKPLTSGSFTLPASSVEGFLYAIKDGKVVPYKVLESKLSPYLVEVAAFPKEGQSPLFNGSVGTFTFSLSRTSGESSRIGDWITLDWQVTGKGAENLKPPTISCQPGIAGFFKLDDLPIQTTGTADERHFIFRLAPLIPGIIEIPPLSWQTFDPTSHKYLTWKSSPISLKPVGLARTSPKSYPSKPLSPLQIPDIGEAKSLFAKGELPLTLLTLQRAWRKNPWSTSIAQGIHDIEERAGLPLSSFPYYNLIVSFLRLLLLPLTFFALWKRIYPLMLFTALLALLLLTPWGKEKGAIMVRSSLTEEGTPSPFFAGEKVNIHSLNSTSALISSKRQAGTVPRSSFISI